MKQRYTNERVHTWQPEAAVYCTATVEALCDALFNVIIKNLHDEAATGVAPLVH